MSTLLISNSDCLYHEVPKGYPERPDRLRVIERMLEHERFSPLQREQAPLADVAHLAYAHPQSHIEHMLARVPKEGFEELDHDTMISPGSIHAAMLSAGGAILGVDEILQTKVSNVFVATRPPGHHAEYDKAMGFCFFNNAAIAARYAQKHYGLERVAIVDFDVHHGNGTQDIFWRDPAVMYVSTHEMPLYPGTGAMNERGEHDQIVNAPLSSGDGSEAFRQAYDDLIIPRLLNFNPDLVIISAGFDAHQRDPLANINLTEVDFAWITKRLMDVASQCCDHRVLSLLEGGYDLEGLGRSVAAHVMALMRG